MDESLPFQKNTSNLEASVNTVLQYFMPTLTALSIPLSLINLVVFLKTGIVNSPSNLIYFNLVVMDLLNSVIGVGVSVDMWNDADHKSRNHWGNGTLLQRVDCYIFLFTFDANIFLVFGLVLIRVLWLKMSALSVIRKLKIISWIALGFAYFIGVESCVYAHFDKTLKERVPYPNTYIEATDLIECLVILITISLSVYTQIRIRCYKSQLNESIYRSASWTSFVLTLNLAVSYSYYLVVNGARIYGKMKRHNQKKCNNVQWTWIDIFLCDFLYVGVACMCFNSFVNNLILLWQVSYDLVYTSLSDQQDHSYILTVKL